MSNPMQFSAGPYQAPQHPETVNILAKSVEHLLAERKANGCWGDKSELDEFISTCHVSMTLQALGIPNGTRLLSNALEFLVSLDTDRYTSFYYRSGALLNITEYAEIVRQDIEYIWKYKSRVAVHKDYPVPFFLLKLISFCNNQFELTFSRNELVEHIFNEWNDRDCWYGRTSITSMALPLIWQDDFENHAEIKKKCLEFVTASFASGAQPGWSPNLVDNAFTIFNLCDNGFLNEVDNAQLLKQVETVAQHLEAMLADDGLIESPPPFGGDIGSTVYPTAVAVRAVTAFYSLQDPRICSDICGALVGNAVASNNIDESLKPFWGEPTKPPELGGCFVVMPFEDLLSDVYREHVKKPIEQSVGMRVFRADDIFQSTQIMQDIFSSIYHADLVVADLSRKNANVYYELGIAHALGKKVIMITDNIDDVPFDLKPIRCITYRHSPTGYRELSERIVSFVTEALRGR